MFVELHRDAESHRIARFWRSRTEFKRQFGRSRSTAKTARGNRLGEAVALVIPRVGFALVTRRFGHKPVRIGWVNAWHIFESQYLSEIVPATWIASGFSAVIT